jgi:hypothetical protein
MANPQNLKPFKKGRKGKDAEIDTRINRLGRPKNFDMVRQLAQEIAGEELDPKNPAVTRIVAMLRLMTSSNNHADRELFLAYAVGRPKDVIDITSKGESIAPAKETDAAKFDRAVSTLLDALGEAVPGAGVKPDSQLGSTEQASVDGSVKPG